jgi:hypothetical protein
VGSLQTVQLFVGSIRHREKLRLVNQAMVNCIQGELVEDVVQMILYGLLGDEKSFADFLVPEALRDELNKFFFAVAKQRLKTSQNWRRTENLAFQIRSS